MKLACITLTGLVAVAAAAAPPLPQEVSQEQAAELYKARCQKCHGPEGHAKQKGAGMSFADGEWKHGSDLKTIEGIITNGVPETGMEPFKDELAPEEIQALARYVRSLDKNLKE